MTGVEALRDEKWDRRSMLLIEGAAILRAFREPGIIASRVRFRAFSKKGCPLLRTIFYGERMIPGDPEAWLRDVRNDHRVYA